MPYPRQHKAKIKQRILKSATDLFARYGFDRVSITEVMQRAKMTHGAFYTHFSSKEALYRESFGAALKRSRAARLMKGPFPIQSLMNLVSGYLKLDNASTEDARAIPNAEAFLSNDIGNSNSEVKKLYELSYLSLLKIFETRLKALTRLKSSPLKICETTIPEKSRAILACMVGALAIAKTINLEREREAILVAAQNQIFVILGLEGDPLRA